MPNYTRSKNLFGDLDKSIKDRLDKFFTHPNEETWDDVHSIIIGADGFTTFWQAVIAVDDKFPKVGPTYSMNGQKVTNWPRIPDTFTALRALKFAQGDLDFAIRRWTVPSSSVRGKTYTVAKDSEGRWLCTCPHWIYRLWDTFGECHHIKRVKHGYVKKRPALEICNVEAPFFDSDSFTLKIPNAQDTRKEAMIVLFLLEHGFSMAEVREIRGIPKTWTVERLESYLEFTKPS